MEALCMMKTGMAPPITSSQNPLTFAATFLNAATQALNSLQQGADPHEVLSFLHLAGPGILAHLKRFANDPIRKPIFGQMMKQWKQLGAVTDKLAKQVQQMDQQKAQQAQAMQQAQSDQGVKMFKAASAAKLSEAKARHAMALKEASTRHQLALSDAQAASNVHRANLQALSQ
jgi:hypothetical protein